MSRIELDAHYFDLLHAAAAAAAAAALLLFLWWRCGDAGMAAEA